MNNCKNCKKYRDCVSTGTLIWPCGAYRPAAITNADRIRAMSDEELAKIVMCPNDVGLRDISCERDDDCDCYACILDWLQQPAGEEDSGGH